MSQPKVKRSYESIRSEYYDMELDEKKAYLDKLYWNEQHQLLTDLLYDTDPLDLEYVNPYGQQECGHDSALAAGLAN